MLKTAIDRTSKLFFLYLIGYTLPYLPHKAVCMLAVCSGLISYFVDKKKYNALRDEVESLFGEKVSEKELKTLVKRSLCNFRKDHFETWAFPGLNENKVRKLCSFVGKQQLDKALEEKKGAILLLAHFGAYKFILPALGYEGYKINQFAVTPATWNNGRLIRHKVMDMEFAGEKALPVNFIYADVNKTMRPVFDVLLKNEILVMTVDSLVGTKNKVPIKFWNRYLLCSYTPVLLSLKTGTPLIPTFIIRQQDNTHEIIFEKPLLVDSGKDKRCIIKEVIRNFVTMLEEYFVKYPWHYARFLLDLRREGIIRDIGKDEQVL